ncbi:MAG: NfeD family protein [Planctomycetota bacterium]|nr:NfeD family protein [Planctomycetota bacterium]
MLLVWGFGLLMLAILLIVIEVMVPSGGVIALVAGAVAIASIIFFWRYSLTWGLISLIAVMILAPTSVVFALKVWPNTYFGSRLIHGAREDDETMMRDRERRAEEAQARQALVGARGEALTDLRPVGTVRIEGERVEALAEGGVIDAGATVRVTSVDGNQIRVRAVV